MSSTVPSRFSGIEAAIILCRGRSFFAGADITEFGQDDTGPGWGEVDRAIDLCAKPILAAIHGNCLGGGFEIALACQYRIAEGTAVFGLPEVKLGLIPGAGGTQRFTRLAGFAAALDIIPSGRSIAAEEALRLGAIDRIAEGGLEADALAFAQALIASSRKGILARARNRSDKIAEPEPERFDRARENARSAIAASRRASRHRGHRECRAYELRGGDGGRGHDLPAAKPPPSTAPGLSLLPTRAWRVPDGRQICRRAKSACCRRRRRPMGRGICLALAERACRHSCRDIEPARDSAMELIRREIAGNIAGKAGRPAPSSVCRGSRAPHPRSAAGADLVIEAIFEDLEAKKILADLDRIMAKGVILASNTSNLYINRIAAATARPQDVLGLHFFSPANIMKLLEIVRGDETSPEVVATALALARRLDKQPVVARVCDGFIANRVFDSYWRQTRFLVEEGASPYEIDEALLAFGMPLGLLAVNDLVGLDVAAQIRRNRRVRLPADARLDTIEDELAAAGRWGRKNGRGWYLYEKDARTGTPDPEVLAAIGAYRRRNGFTPRRISPEEIVERCIYALVNEGAREIEEGIALRASDIDVAAVNGFGFPRYRGGPMRYAEDIGLKSVAAKIEAFHARLGYWWKPPRCCSILPNRGAASPTPRGQPGS
jgi:3-hydroxyacyl-CoA dehydrogenase